MSYERQEEMRHDRYKGLTALVVDDFFIMRGILRAVLKDLGFVGILEAEDGTQALSIVERQKVDLIISNWNMPGLSGLELLKRVRCRHETRETPFLMVTSEGEQERIVQAVKERVSDYVIKPFSPKNLGERVEKIVNAHFLGTRYEDWVVLE